VAGKRITVTIENHRETPKRVAIFSGKKWGKIGDISYRFISDLGFRQIDENG
jgi:hypothetical protein